MNRKQLIVMWVAILVIAGMFMFPPWRFSYYIGEGHAVKLGPYSLFCLPPKPPELLPVIELDLSRLFPPIFIIMIIAGGLMVTFRDRRPPSA